MRSICYSDEIYSMIIRIVFSFLKLISDSFDHPLDRRIEWEFWHLSIHDHIHISRLSIDGSSFTGDFEFGSWLGSCFYLESEVFSIDSFHRDRILREKVEEWYFDCFCHIEIWDFFFWFFSLFSRSSILTPSTSE